MFCIDPAPTFEADVPIPVIGQAEPAHLACTFKHRKVSELAALQRRLSASEVDDVQVLLELVHAWQMQRADGSAVPFNADTLRELIDAYPHAAVSIYQAYQDALQRARLGN